MKSIMFVLVVFAFGTSLYAKHQVLGQSPRNAKVYNEKALLSENGVVKKPVLAIFNAKDK